MSVPLQQPSAGLAARSCGASRGSRVSSSLLVGARRESHPANCSIARIAGSAHPSPSSSRRASGQICRAAVDFNDTVGNATRSGGNQDAYNKAMQAYSNSPFEYKHEMGLYYHYILPNMMVGTQPQRPEDIDRLVTEEGVTCILNSQQDKDMAYWQVDFPAIRHRCSGRGVVMARHPFPDFNAEGLRHGLPSAVALLDGLLDNGHRVYLHCTAGMGRSPGVAIAYLYWCCNHGTLDSAYEFLTSRRPCGPNKDAIRKSTCDMIEHMRGGLPPPSDIQWADWQGQSLNNEQKVHIKNLLLASRPAIPPTSAFSILFKDE